jgi:ABC-2 type transport system ATP-binding protein
MAEKLIEAHGLQKRFGATEAVSGIDLTLQSGDLLGLVGPDGAGKTTTIRLLCGALSPSAGKVSICGIDLARQADRARENIGYLSQRFSLYEDLTVLENLRFFAEVRGLSASSWKPRALEILDFVGLGEFAERPAGQLSGGMKQKLGLASALVHKPRVLLLDEPTGGVDPVTRQDFWQLIIRLVSQEGVGVLISTPYMDEATRCKHVSILSAGRVLMQGAPSELCAQLNNRILEVRGKPLTKIRQAASNLTEIEDVQAFGDRLHMRVKAGQAQQAQKSLQEAVRQNGWELDHLGIITPQLEDVFIAASAGETRG